MCIDHFLYITLDVLWVPPMKFSSWCEMNLRKWPMDTQVCELKFGSWTHSGLEILLGFYQNDPNGPRVSSTSKKLIYTLLQILLEILKTYLNLKHFAIFRLSWTTTNNLATSGKL